MITINNNIQRAMFFELLIATDQIDTSDCTRNFTITDIVKDRSFFWAKKTYEKRFFSIKLFKIFSEVPTFNDGEMKYCFVITGHVYGGQTGKDVSGGDAYDAAEDFETYIKTGTSPWIKQIARNERSK